MGNCETTSCDLNFVVVVGKSSGSESEAWLRAMPMSERPFERAAEGTLPECGNGLGVWGTTWAEFVARAVAFDFRYHPEKRVFLKTRMTDGSWLGAQGSLENGMKGVPSIESLFLLYNVLTSAYLLYIFSMTISLLLYLN